MGLGIRVELNVESQTLMHRLSTLLDDEPLWWINPVKSDVYKHRRRMPLAGPPYHQQTGQTDKHFCYRYRRWSYVFSLCLLTNYASRAFYDVIGTGKVITGTYSKTAS